MPTRKTLELFAPFFVELTDPRLNRCKRHPLLDILILAVCATLGGADGWADIERFGKAKLDFFRRFLDWPHGIPSHDTFGRVFARLDPAALLACIQQWLTALAGTVAGEVVAIDGKTLRGSFDTVAAHNPLHLVSAWATQTRLLLGQVAVDSKSNEITAIPLLLELLDLRGCIVTLDAMGCQREIVAALRDGEADYVITLKANQGTLYDDVAGFFIDALEHDFAGIDHRYLKTVDHGHGRHETRHYYSVPVPEALQRMHAWQDLRSLGMVYAERHVGDAEPVGETRFFISSLPPKVKTFARAVRSHWGIENRQSDYCSSDTLCVTGLAPYYSRRGPTGAGRMVRSASWPRRQVMPSNDRVCAPPRP